MIAGEGQASQSWMTGGAWIETAEKYGALLFELEHRFYGESHPFEYVFPLATKTTRYANEDKSCHSEK